MLRYNTQLKPLVLPEYGRVIQSMVDHCLTIEDRQERTRCARSIITVMSNLFPELRNNNEYKHKLWDHLAIMSNFQLDIDYPCEVIQADNLHTRPEKVEYSNDYIHYRHYGKSVEWMIWRATEMEPGDERNALVKYVANHMKKLLIAVNPDSVDDSRIFRDIAEMSHGDIRINAEDLRLHEFKEAPVQQNCKKKRKK